ncbi:MAG: M15 family peptidase [Parvibaculales bacterium]
MPPPYRYSKNSLTQLKSCHADLQLIFSTLITQMDCSILAGYRDAKSQNKLYEQGFSKCRYPHSRHNSQPAMAVDVAPYRADIKGGVDWQNTASFAYLAGHARAIAWALKTQGRISHELVWGGDWNQNGQMHDENFADLVHFELR